MTRPTPSFPRVLALALVATTPLLSGCQWFGGRTSLASAELRRSIPADYGAEQLAAGREALKAGRTSEAIEDFMVAKLYPEQAAAAFNGLAVAYSRLGRTDLAERFFRSAVALAPENDRYRSNLAMFYSRNGIPKSNGESRALALEADPAAISAQQAKVDDEVIRHVPIQLRGGITVETAAVPVDRISKHEVLVGEHPAGSVAVHNPKGSGTRIAVNTRPSYPIRISLPDESKAEAVRTSEYPIRISLSNAAGS